MKEEMDAIDTKQQEEIDRLNKQAEHKRAVDLWQWVLILALGFGGLVYLNAVFTSIIRQQAHSIQILTETCVK